MNFVDGKYISLLSGSLLKFKQKNNVYNFRCPICGDSKKNKAKSRGYIYEKNGCYHFKCQNCGVALPFPKFLKEVNPALYEDYQMETFFKKKEDTLVVPETKKPSHYNVEVFSELISIANLEETSPYKSYVVGRLIPEKFYDKLFVTEEFKHFTNKLIPGKFVETMDEPRLVIPFFDENKQVIAYAGRSFKKFTQLRYINITLNENKPKLFGIDRWNKNEETVVVEGPLDSLFLNNCIASAGGDLTSVIRDYDKSKFIICYDNEPNSKTTRDKILKVIRQGYRVVIWPNNIKFKDINKMVLEGMKPLDIERIIRENTYSGLESELKFSFWR